MTQIAQVLVPVSEIIKALQERKDRSAWDRGVTAYALDLLEGIVLIPCNNTENASRALLKGADNWQQYSEGGSALIYNEDIAERLCTPSELRARRGGMWMPSRGVTWLDEQARALYHASCRIYDVTRPWRKAAMGK